MTDRDHEPFGGAGDWFCYIHQASFEIHEAEENGGDCPWCGQEVTRDA
jgi:hypothetical protein